MTAERRMFGARSQQYGVWNIGRKCWQFGICEETPMLAEARLFQKLGNDARKWRFEIRALPANMRNAKPDPLLMAELQHKDREIKCLKQELTALKQQLKTNMEAC